MQTIRQRLHALLLLAALTISLAVPASAAGSLPFTDVDPSEWYYTYVQDLYDAGIVDGVTSTAFRPEGTVTFGQALKLVLMAAGYENQAPTGTHWASGFYDLAQREGLLPSGLNLGLDDAITRLEIAEITVLAMDLSRTSQDPSPFDDTDAEAALILWDHGIFEGSASGDQILFQPQDDISRAEITTVIWRIYHYTPPESPETPPTSPEDPDAPEGITSTSATKRSMWWKKCQNGPMIPPSSR